MASSRLSCFRQLGLCPKLGFRGSAQLQAWEGRSRASRTLKIRRVSSLHFWSFSKEKVDGAPAYNQPSSCH